MKYFTFYRESNNFDDILKDSKKYIKLKIKWSNYLMLGISEYKTDSVSSIIMLKYGDDMVTDLVKDFTPKPDIDYIPKRRIK